MSNPVLQSLEVLKNRISSGDFPRHNAPPIPENAVNIFEAMLDCRILDHAGRLLQSRGEGYYTIGSSGHEAMAMVANALHVSDPAFLHYRDAAFQLMRAKQAKHDAVIDDMLLSFMASIDDPISGGRHKVLGSKLLNIPPQTSTIASHLPKAVGVAFSIGLAKQTKHQGEYPMDAIAMASFGDASLNHASAQTAINAAGWSAAQGVELPLLLICEDNGIGISTSTPKNWVQNSMKNRADIEYRFANGRDPLAAASDIANAVQIVRQTRRPVFLHLLTYRYFGHAGSDIETSYRDSGVIEKELGNDPLILAAAQLVENGHSPQNLVKTIDNRLQNIETRITALTPTRHLETRDEIRSSLTPKTRPRNIKRHLMPQDAASMNKLIARSLEELMVQYPEIILAGEDIGTKGGVYGATSGLHKKFGSARVINTLLDETTILGLGIGLAHNRFIPIVEIQFLAYLHNAEDQLRGEAATLSFFSNGQFQNGMVIRIAGFGYQRGFGGHFHNDNSLAVLRDIPGIVIGVPARGRDAVMMLHEAVRLADAGQVVVIVEPIARYATRDLLKDGDELWLDEYPNQDTINVGQIDYTDQGADVTIITYGNGVYLAHQAVHHLAKDGVNVDVLDYRWIAPLPIDEIDAVLPKNRQILVLDECRGTASQSEGLITALLEKGRSGDHLRRLTADDCFIPLGSAATIPLPSHEEIARFIKQCYG